VAIRRAYTTQTPVTLVLDGFPSKAQAALLGPNNGTRRYGVDAERERIHGWVAVEVVRQQIGAVRPPVRAVYTFVVPDRIRRDWDNYALMVKPVQDGLVMAGVLEGDHFAVLEGAVRFRVEPGQRRLEITLEGIA